MATVYFEDVQEGTLVPPLTKQPTTRQLVMWAGAIGDYAEIHYDLRAAQAAKLSDVIIHGALKCAFLGQLVTDWIGPDGTLEKLGASYRGMDSPGKSITCKGRVVKKTRVGKKNIVECDVWIENEKGDTTTTGKAVVALPSRG